MRKIKKFFGINLIAIFVLVLSSLFISTAAYADISPSMGSDSLYTLTKVTPQDVSNLPPNVFKYYNPNVSDEVSYYRVDFKSSEIGSGSNVKYYKWSAENNGLLIECSQSESVLTVRYDANNPIESILVDEGTTGADVSNIYIGQSIKQAIDSKGTIAKVESTFAGNTIEVDSQDTFNYSAVLAEAMGEIDTVKSSFIANTINIDATKTMYGTLVKSLGVIDNINSEFISNKVTTNTNVFGGLVETPGAGVIGTVKSDFINNIIIGTNGASISGGVFSNEGTVATMIDSLFINNGAVSDSGDVKGGAVFNSGTFTNSIQNAYFGNNYAKSVSGNAKGGALSNELSVNIENSQFVGNYAESTSGTAHGGALYTDSDLSISATDGNTTLFKDNYVLNNGVKDDEAIYVAKRDATLTVNATGGGTVQFDDKISGERGYRIILTGDNTSNIAINNNITNANISAADVNISTADGVIREQVLVSLNTADTAKWSLDINFGNNKIDSFTVGSASGGTLYINNLNDVSANGFTSDNTILYQIINGGAVNVVLSDAIKEAYRSREFYMHWAAAKEAIGSDVRWDKEYYQCNYDTYINSGLREAKSDSSLTYNDSIEYYVETEDVDLGDTKIGDTLRLMNQSAGTRSFTANSAEQTYNVGEDSGSTATGAFTVRGLIDEENSAISTLDAGEHTLFVLDKSGASVTLRDLYLTSDNTSDGSILNITNGSANIIGTSATLPLTIESAAENGIVNNSELYFASSNILSELYTGIAGLGYTTVSGGIAKMLGDASISQYAVDVSSGAQLYMGDNSTIKADLINNAGKLSVVADNLLSDVTNTGNVELRGGTLSKNINGSYTTMAGDVEIAHGENVSASVNNVRFVNNSSLIANANDIKGNVQATGLVDKSTASMTLTGGTLAGNVAMDNKFVINIDGEVTYGSATTNGVVAKSVVPAGSTLNAGLNLSNDGLVANNGILNLSSTGTTVNEVATITGTGATNISNTISAASITQNTLNISEGATFISAHNGTFKINNIANDGVLIFRGHGRSLSQANNIISEIHGSVIGTDENNNPIYKDTGKVYFGNGSSGYYIELRDIKISQPMTILTNHSLNVYNVTNGINGEVTINSGATMSINAAGTLNKNVKGAGTLTVAIGTLTNNADISTKININSSRTLTTDASKVHKAINDAGTLTLNSSKNSNGDGSSTFKLDDTAAVTGAGAVTIAQGANVILESALQNTGAKNVSKNATLTSNANLLTNGNVNLNYEGAKLNLTGGNIVVQVNGAQNGELHITGDVTDEAKNIGAKVVVDEGGTLRASSNLLANSRDTIDNYGSYYTNGDLARAITKSGTTYIDGVLNFSGNAEIEGTLDLNNGTLDIYGTTANYNVGKAVGEGSLLLDLDTHNNTATTLTLGPVSDAVFNLTGINTTAVYGDYAAGHRSGIIQILKGGSNATLALNQRLNIWDDDSSEIVVGDVTSNVYFDDEYYARERNFYIEGYVDLATTDSEYDSIEWVITDEREELSDLERKDLLSSWNQNIFDSSGDEDKTFSFKTSNDKYDSLEDVGKTKGKNVSVIGVADANNTVTYKKAEASTYNQAQKSIIALGGHKGFELGENTVFNVSDTKFTGGTDFVIQSNGATIGNIDDEHNVTGGIVNSDFVGAESNISSSGTETGGIVYIGDNSTVSQIKDVIVKDVKLSFTGEDLANSSPEGRLGAIYLGSGAKVGDTYTDAEGNKVNVGGILNTVIDGTVGTINNANGVTAKTNATSGMVITGGAISTIKNSIITNNTTTADNTSIIRGTAISMFGGSIDTMENVEISNNIANAGNQNIYGGAMYIGGPINTIKNSKFVNNRAESTGSSVLGGAFELTGTGSVITLIDDTLFDSNFAATHGGAIYDNGTIKTIKNSTFTNNSTAGEGGAIRVAAGHYIDTIAGSNFEGNTAKTAGGAIRLYGTGATAATLTGLYNLSNTTFKNNSVINNGTVSEATGNGGAISITYMNVVSGVTETIWSDLTFEGNSVRTKTGTASGGAVYMASGSSPIDIKNSTFKDNYINASNWSYGGALYAQKSIRKLDNVTFEGNYASAGSSNRSFGGAIFVGANTTISSIINSTFKNNRVVNAGYSLGGAITMNNNQNSRITKIENTKFEGNSVQTSGAYAYGGAIEKEAASILGSIVNTRFIGNYAKGKTVLGGAIYFAGSGQTLDIIADNGLTEFTGNYVQSNSSTTPSYQAIWLNKPTDGNLPILTMQAKGENGHFLLNDFVNGSSGYTTNIKGDGLGTFSMFSTIVSSNIVTDNVNINLINNDSTKEGLAKLYSHTFLSLTTDETTKWNIDIDFSNDVKKADNFKLTNASSGTMYINSLNVLNDATERTKVQVLKTINDDIQLKLNENNIHVVTDLVDNLGDTVYDNANYVQEEGYALSTTDTTNDSILRLVEQKFDNLDLISSSENNAERNFIFNSNNDYVLSVDMQDTAAGKLTVTGKSDGSVIDGNEHSMFNLSNETELVLKDTKLTNGANDTVINVENAGAVITLNDATIDGNITATKNYDMNISGTKTTEFTGTVQNANTSLNGGTLKFVQNTFADTGDSVEFNSGSVALANGAVENYVINKLVSEEAVKYSIDLDLSAKSADTIATLDDYSSGTVFIDSVNYLNGDENVEDFEVQILKNAENNDSLTLALSDNLTNYTIKNITRYDNDQIKEVTNFNETYYIREVQGTLDTEMYVTTKDTLNDTLGVRTVSNWDESSSRIYDKLGDTLALVNASEQEYRTFESLNATDVYRLTEDLTETAQGVLTLSGVTNGDNRSTINLQNNDGFTLGEDTTLDINNVKLTGNDTIVTVNDSSSFVKLTNATIEGDIVGTDDTPFALDITGQGKTIINGEVKGADVTLKKGELVIATDTFADSNTTLDADNATITTVNDAIENYNINQITSTDSVKYNIDVDLTNRTADTFVAEGSGIITLDSFNIAGQIEGLSVDDRYVIQILKTSEDDLQLRISEYVMSQLDNGYKMGEKSELDHTDTVNAKVSWTDVLKAYYRDYDIYGKLQLSTTETTNDSIEMFGIDVREKQGHEEYGDILALWNQANQTEDKEFNFDNGATAESVYNLTEDVGATKGAVASINGVAGQDAQGNPISSTIDMNSHGGFVLGDKTELTVSNITFTDMKETQGGLFNIQNSDAVVNFDNVTIDTESVINGIVNSGTVNMTGGTVNLGTGITGFGETNVTGGADVIVKDNISITQENINVEDGSLTMGANSIIDGNLSIGEDGAVTVGVNGITAAVVNDGDITFNTSGDLTESISGEGTTHIAGDIVNKATIDQDVDIAQGSSLQSHTDNLGGGINNNGDLLLKGAIDDVITGSGITTINESLNLLDGSGVVGTLDLNDGTVSTVDSKISDIEIGKLENDGTFTIDVDGATKKADKFVVGDNSEANIFIDDINLSNASSVTADFIAQVTEGSEDVQITLSDTLKAKDWTLGRTSRDEEDVVQAVTNYDDIYHTYVRGGDLVGNLIEAATNYEYDSIKMVIDYSKTKWDENRSQNGVMGDTLYLWNTLDTQVDKKFVYDKAQAYTWGENATGTGDTKGNNVTLQGFSASETVKSSIDLTEKTGFNLVDATTFNINDMKLTGTDVVTVSNEDASINIKDSYIQGNISAAATTTTAPSNFNVTIAGEDTTTLRGTFTNADTTLTSGNLKLNTNTFADETDTLTTNGGTVLLNNDTIEDYVINDLTSASAANYKIDINFATQEADTISVNSGSGIVTLDSLNIIADASQEIVDAAYAANNKYVIQILKLANQDDDLQLALSSTVQGQLENQPDQPYVIGVATEHTKDPLKQSTNWQDVYYKWKQDTETLGTLQLATTDTENDSIGVKVSGTNVKDKELDGTQGDTLKVVNQSDEIANKDFVFDTPSDEYVVGENLGTTSGTVNIKGQTGTIINDQTGEESVSTSTVNFNGNSGFELVQGADVTVENATLTGASGETGSVINAQGTDSQIDLKNVNILDNASTGEHGGAIYSNSDVNITTDNYNSVIAGNSVNGKDEAIYLDSDAKLTLDTKNNATVIIADKVASGNNNTIALKGDETGSVTLLNTVDDSTVTMDEITLNLASNNHFETSDVTINSGTLNLVNNGVQDQKAKSFTVNGSFKVNADVDLNRQRMDRLPENTVVNNRATIHVDKLNLLSDTKARSVAIPFAYYGFKSNVDYIGPKTLSKATQVTTAYAPIFKYSVKYEERDDMGYFVFGHGGGDKASDFNPSVLVTPVATQVGGYLTQLETLHEGFYHMERYTKYSSSDRMAAENINRTASLDNVANVSKSPLPLTSQAFWTKPYATFENVRLRGGVKVHNFAYGSYFGGDTDLIDMAHGWKRITSAFIGYNGNHMSYNGVSMDMQGGAFGMTETFYKGNFFTGITASVGASAGEAYTMYGTDRFSMLTAGVANKTGYNWELFNGGLIIQPSLFTGYVFVNTFDYRNAANVKINSDALNAIQIIPGIKIIGNLKHGWQPYLGVNMVWNIMDKTHVYANDVKLPQFSVKPYVEYGLGIQKSWNDRFTAYFQSMLRGGGRNGVVLTAGFRWTFGK